MSHDDSSSQTRAPESPFNYGEIWSVLAAEKRTIVVTTGISLLLGIFYLLATASTYRSDSLLHVQDPSGLRLPGMSLLQEFSGDPTGTAETEVQIIRSRSVIGDTVDRLNLATNVEPDFFPMFGYAIARFRSNPQDDGDAVKDEDDGFWLTNYLWTPGGMRIDRFVIPERLYGESFTVRALSTDQYVLFGPDGERVLAGSVGTVAAGETSNSDRVEVFVTEIAPAAFPSDYTVTSRHWLEAVTELQDDISVTELGRDSRIVKISLEGQDPDKITQVVNSVAETYLRQNVETQSKQAGRRLEILESQLPELKDSLDAAELRLNDYREQNLALDLGVEARALLEQVVEIEQQMSEFELKRAELRQTYTVEHPYLRAIGDQVQSLELAKRKLEVEIEALPDSQREMLALTRDVGVSTALYLEFMNNAQELRLMESGSVGNVRIIDRAVVPVDPIKPQASLVLITALILGTMAGIAVSFLRSFAHAEGA